MNVEYFHRTLAQEAGDAIIFSDVEGTIQLWNRGAERVSGYAKRNALGRSLDIIIHGNLHERHWRGYARMVKIGSIANSTFLERPQPGNDFQDPRKGCVVQTRERLASKRLRPACRVDFTSGVLI